jgi:hypothetical protein
VYQSKLSCGINVERAVTAALYVKRITAGVVCFRHHFLNHHKGVVMRYHPDGVASLIACIVAPEGVGNEQ